MLPSPLTWLNFSFSYDGIRAGRDLFYICNRSGRTSTLLHHQQTCFLCYILYVKRSSFKRSSAGGGYTTQLDPVVVYAAWGWLSVEINGVSFLPWPGLAWLGLAWHSGGRRLICFHSHYKAPDVFFYHRKTNWPC